jgi:TetR/AcrR family transcriptional repressor of nem operon
VEPARPAGVPPHQDGGERESVVDRAVRPYTDVPSAGYGFSVPDDQGQRPPRLTARGAATRARILQAADELIRVHGVNRTRLDDVRAATGVSKSQLYHHFPDKEALVAAVIARRAEVILEREAAMLGRVDSMRGLERWRDAAVNRVQLRRGAHGCALGSLLSELADQDESALTSLTEHFTTWEMLMRGALDRMQANGALRPDADTGRLATGLMAALQGGYLLSQATQDASPMEASLNMALENIGSYVEKAA